MKAKKKSAFGTGLAIGAVVGAAAAAFLSPNSGKQNRRELQKRAKELEKFVRRQASDKNVKKVFGTVTDEARRAFEEARDRVADTVANVKDLDRKDYEEAVKSAVDAVKKSSSVPAEAFQSLQKELSGYWKALFSEGSTENLKKAGKTAVKKAKKTRKRV